jgi:hypothetical protein
MELDPQQPGAAGALAEIAKNTGDGAGQVVWGMVARRIDPKDHEIPTMIATSLAYLGELAAADAWIDESLRIAPGHLYPESRRVELAFVRGDYKRARELGLSFAPRAAEDVQGSWLYALEGACAAGALQGEGAQVRAELEQLKVIPRELTAAGFRALDATHVSAAERVDNMQWFLHCAFGTGGDDSARKKDLLAAYAELLGNDWAKRHSQWFMDGYLHGDRERMVLGLLPESGREKNLIELPWYGEFARIAGVDGDPRLKAYFAELRARLAQSRAELPQRLKEQGLTLMP